MEEDIDKLRARVSHLEDELGTSYEDARFKSMLERIFPEDANVDVQDGRFGQFARVTNIDGDDAQEVLDKLEGSLFGSALTETSEGLGIEVWDEETHGRA